MMDLERFTTEAAKDLLTRLTEMTMERDELRSRLAEAVERMETVTNDLEGDDRFEFSCPNCHGVPMPHSWGCNVRELLHNTKASR